MAQGGREEREETGFLRSGAEGEEREILAHGGGLPEGEEEATVDEAMGNGEGVAQASAKRGAAGAGEKAALPAGGSRFLGAGPLERTGLGPAPFGEEDFGLGVEAAGFFGEAEESLAPSGAEAKAPAPGSLGNVQVRYYVTDHLGTPRVVLDGQGSVLDRHDYEPYGVEIGPFTDQAALRQRYTVHERDRATGYDYMHYRFYAGTLGRFLRPDNIPGTPANPQSWNLYAYVHGNPVNLNDPTGHQAASPEDTIPIDPAGNLFNGGDSSHGQLLSGQVDKRVMALVNQLQKGSLRLSANFVSALLKSAAFREGVERWLRTKVGQEQVKMYQGDKNTIYTLNVGSLPSKDLEATAETIASGHETRIGPTKAVENTYIEITVNLARIEEQCGNGAKRQNERDDAIAQRVAYDLGHEGFHAHDLGSGLITETGYFVRKNRLDNPDQYGMDPREKAWREIIGY